MNSKLIHSMFYDVFFPDTSKNNEEASQLCLQKILRFRPNEKQSMSNADIVVFDFETTGLDTTLDRIIEIGAIKYRNHQEIDSWTQLINPGMNLTETAANITGISNEMLADQPFISEVLDDFLQFIEGSILCAHNAEFDMAFLKSACQKAGYQLVWPCFCTLRMARVLIPELPSKNLDTLAKHFELTFDARHRSMGDCRVTGSVLYEMTKTHSQSLKKWGDFDPYTVGKIS